MDKGCRYGTHRVITPEGTLPQPALRLDNTMSIYDNLKKVLFKSLWHRDIDSRE